MKIFGVILLVLFTTSCSTSISQQLLGRELPLFKQTRTDNESKITFSHNKKYKNRGVPIKGEPVVCVNNNLVTTKKGDVDINQIYVPSGEELILTSFINWQSSGFGKSCGKFVKFTPEANTEYVVINEKIGGTWTGVATQTCKVSVYEIEKEYDSFKKVFAQVVDSSSCSK